MDAVSRSNWQVSGAGAPYVLHVRVQAGLVEAGQTARVCG